MPGNSRQSAGHRPEPSPPGLKNRGAGRDGGRRRWLVQPEFAVERDPERCIQCQVCVRQCSNDVHEYASEDDLVSSESSRCVGCHRCATLCPTDAISIKQAIHAYLIGSSLITDIVGSLVYYRTAPQNIENLLKTDPFISQVMVHGDKRKFLSAIITLLHSKDYPLLITHLASPAECADPTPFLRRVRPQPPARALGQVQGQAHRGTEDRATSSASHSPGVVLRSSVP